MIVYNVQRRWFAEKAVAEQYRVAEGLRPSATLTLRVDDRNALVALLTALCDPGAAEVLAIADKHGLDKIKAAVLVDHAYVPVDRDIPDCIPEFLLKAHGLTRDPK